MRQWAVYYTRNPDGSYSDKLGSDGIAQLDARFGLSGRMAQARVLAKSRRGIHGFRLARGNRVDQLFFLQATIQPLEIS